MGATAGERGYFPFLGVRGRRVAVLCLSFSPNGAGSITVTNKQAQRGLLSVNHTGTGTYVLTLTEKYSSLLSYFATVRVPTGGTAWFVQIIGTPSLGASGGATIPITTFNSVGSAADISADPQAEVCITLFLSKSSLEKES